MVLRKITIDSSVEYIPKNDQTKERDTKQNTIINRKQNKNISQNGKNLPKDTIRGEGFRMNK